MRARILVATGILLTAALPAQRLPQVPVPPQNPITPEKAVLGKALFWDEQLSSDDTMSCGTCHRPANGGTDPRIGLNPGPDRRAGTPDDIRASFGIVRQDGAEEFAPDPVFGLDRQVTPRTAQSAITSQFSPQQFWDGRAGPTFVDPLTNQVVIPGGGSLEAQSIAPLMNTAEMGHDGRVWSEIVAKLRDARPLALATNLTPDLTAALAGGAGYPDLFRIAFGDPAITPVRIAFALATYERTLVADQTPFDRFAAGDQNALTQGQRAGLDAFRRSNCDRCHTPPFFTDHTFRALGLRPVQEDAGRQAVTRNFGDRGRFKVPSLRNVGLKRTFMHNGVFSTLDEVFRFYDGRVQSFPDNRDPLLQQVRVPPQVAPALRDFLANALTDPRVSQGLPPFDRPTLRSERAPNRSFGVSAAGAAGATPRLLDHQPAFVGAGDFKVGIRDGLGGAFAIWAISAAQRSYPSPLPVSVDLDLGRTFVGRLDGNGPGAGFGTLPLPLPTDASLAGASLFTQGFVIDPAAAATFGIAATRATEFVIL